MASIIPGSGISLRGAAEDAQDLKSGSSSAILLKLSDGVLQDLQSHAKSGLHFSSGASPKLRIGSRTIDLNISPDAFRNELFASGAGSSTSDFTFSSIISHRAELRAAERKSSSDIAGTDAALATLQNSLASYEQEKQAKQTNITNSILPAPKNRFDAARKERLEKKQLKVGSQHSSPSMNVTGTPTLAPAPTSTPSEDEVKIRAMRQPLMHLLAIRPTRSEEIVRKTHIPKDDLDIMLQKVGKKTEGGWQLTDRAYKDLDVWKFGYSSQEDRQSAIDNAMKAYDRMRLGKEEQLWQMLLPKSERGKGKVLSRLHLGAGQVNRGLTPHYQPSPLPHIDGTSDSRNASAANTPRLGASTPRPGSSMGDVKKRLLSKDPKKARAAEEAKGKKRKEREAAASDREASRPAKRQATKKTAPNTKSAEFVHSSDDESEDETHVKDTNESQVKASQGSAKATAKLKSNVVSTSSDSSDTPLKSVKARDKTATKVKLPTPARKTGTSPAMKANPAGKSTPQMAPIHGLSAPNSRQKSRSPQKDSRPTVPSPLGAARPRVASDVSDRGAVGVQRVTQGGAETPNGLGITNGVRKRQDTLTSTESAVPDKKSKDHGSAEKQQKSTVNGAATPKSGLTNGAAHKVEAPPKRKAEDSTVQQGDNGPGTEHRRTDSTTSQPKKPQDDTAGTPPDGSGSDSARSVIDSITYNQGVALAEKFLEDYYPAYSKLHDELAANEARGEVVSKEDRDRLWAMHRRLETMKREIKLASQREHREE